MADEVLAKARQSGVFAFVSKDLRFSRPEVDVSIDRELAARLGISMEDIGRTLQIMLGEVETNRFSIEGRSYKVIPQADRGFRLTKEWLERYYLRTESGTLVPLSTVITLKQEVKPNTLQAVPAAQQRDHSAGSCCRRTRSATAWRICERRCRKWRRPDIAWTTRASRGASCRRARVSCCCSAARSCSSTSCCRRSSTAFAIPSSCSSAFRLSIFGALVPLAMGMTTLNIYTQVGLLTLIGLISKHGILIVDFANNRLREGADRRAAVLEAAGLRLRPILMTTFATALGVFPLLTAYGAGANARFAIGLMIAAGMLVGTLFTLFVLPTFYLVMGGRTRPDAQAERTSMMPAS